LAKILPDKAMAHI